ncbi:MAG: precorrin-6y C5,15-methyltransferase (decarboxylating) subunit CbiE [Alphaproteobacteria bacterium]|nr:precorrin-6y C5,15-methyltransferase (decarboxylating) subunit CbiE [Alphaproteobacteria bacterium]
MALKNVKTLAQMDVGELASLSAEEIYQFSAQAVDEAIKDEMALAAIAPELHGAARRLIHAAADIGVIKGLHAAPGAVAQIADALQNGATILVDCEMLAAGLKTRLIGRNQVICTLNDQDVPAMAEKLKLTRSAAAVELWREIDNPNGVVAVFGNAPTALFRYLSLLAAGDMPVPRGILGFVVGFVGAAESKALLAESSPAPWIALAGRRGGTALAVAAVNALAPPRDNFAASSGGSDMASKITELPKPAIANNTILHVMGIGADGLESLPAATRRIINQADYIFGGARHLAMAGLPKSAQKFSWQTPLGQTVEQIAELLEAKPQPNIVVLATGDPMWFGIGVTLTKKFSDKIAVKIHPHISAFNLAAARMGWPLAECDCLTLHGRNLAVVRRYVRPQARLLILSADRHTPLQIAQLLAAAGLGQIPVTILAEMGGTGEAQYQYKAEQFAAMGEGFLSQLSDLNTLAVDCQANDGINWPPQFCPSAVALPNQAFHHDGMISKQPMRTLSLALMAPTPGEIWWDIGAGSGAVAIEILRAQFVRQSALTGQVFAIESQAHRAQICRDNALALGFPELQVIEATAPLGLENLPAPHGIFLGGGLRDDIFAAAWDALRCGGRILVNGVTLAGETAILRWYGQYGGALHRVALAHSDTLSSASQGAARENAEHKSEIFRPAIQVTQYLVRKS